MPLKKPLAQVSSYQNINSVPQHPRNPPNVITFYYFLLFWGTLGAQYNWRLPDCKSLHYCTIQKITAIDFANA